MRFLILLFLLLLMLFLIVIFIFLFYPYESIPTKVKAPGLAPGASCIHIRFHAQRARSFPLPAVLPDDR